VLRRMPNPGVVLLMLVMLTLYFGLAGWAWGSWSGLVAHPARAGAFLVTWERVCSLPAADLAAAPVPLLSRQRKLARWIFQPGFPRFLK
jgi:hypothetical protein